MFDTPFLYYDTILYGLSKNIRKNHFSRLHSHIRVPEPECGCVTVYDITTTGKIIGRAVKRLAHTSLMIPPAILSHC